MSDEKEKVSKLGDEVKGWIKNHPLEGFCAGLVGGYIVASQLKEFMFFILIVGAVLAAVWVKRHIFD